MDGPDKETDVKNMPLKLLLLAVAIAGLNACASSASPGATSSAADIENSFKSMWATGPWANDHNFISPR